MENFIKTRFAIRVCVFGLVLAIFPTLTIFSQSLDEENIQVISIDVENLPEVVLQVSGNSLDGEFLDAPISIIENGDERTLVSEELIESSLQLAFVMDPSQNLTAPGNTGDSRWFEVASIASDLVTARILSAQTDLVAAYGPNDETDGFGSLSGWLRDHQAVVNTLYQYEPSESEQSSTIALSDALINVLNEFDDAGLNADAIKAVVVFSDGSDLLQTEKVNQVIDLADELEIQINVVMLGADTPIARGNLDRLSNGTDGLFSVLNSISDVEPLWKMLQQQRTIRELTYELGSVDATSVDISVELPDGENLTTSADYPEFKIEPAEIIILSPFDAQEFTLDLTSADVTDEDLVLPVSLDVLWPEDGVRELKLIDYLIDGDSVAQEATLSDDIMLSLEDLDNGNHTISVVTIDELGVVSTSPSVSFLLDVTRPLSSQELEEAAPSQAAVDIEEPKGDSESVETNSAGSTLIESVSGDPTTEEAEITLAAEESSETTDSIANQAIDNILNDTQLEDEKVGTGMNLFGIQLPDTVEIYGFSFLINPVTLLIAAFPLIVALALLTYWLSQRSNTRTGYRHDYDFYDIGQVPTIENHVFFEDDGQLQVTQPQIGIIDIEDDVTEPVKVPSFYTTAPAYLAYISGGNHLPKKLPVEGNEPIRIGRKKSFCELVLDDRRVSRLHSVISQLNGEFYIRDEGSSGGTFVNRRKLGTVDNQKLDHNDIINFNEVEYRFEVTAEMPGEGSDNSSVYAPPFENVGA